MLHPGQPGGQPGGPGTGSQGVASTRRTLTGLPATGTSSLHFQEGCVLFSRLPPPPPAPVGLPTPATRHLLRPSRHSSLGPTTPVLLRNAGRTETSRLPAADSCPPTSPMGVVSSPASILRGRAEGCGGCRGGAGGARTLEPPPLPPPRPAGSSKGRIRTPAGLPSCRDGTPDPPTSFRSPLSPTTAATVFSTITT